MKPERSLVSIGRLPSRSMNRLRAGDRLLARVERDDHLDERHHRHRREEVQPEHARGIADRLGELGDRDRGRVGGDDRPVRDHAVDRLHDRELEPLVLGHRLDDQVGLGDRLEVGGQLDPLARRPRLGVVELAAAHGPGQRGLDPLAGATHRSLVDVAHDHRHARPPPPARRCRCP